MKRFYRIFTFLFITLWCVNLNAQEVDWSSYAALLAKHVQAGSKDNVELNAVDYPGLKNDPLFDQVVEQLNKTNPKKLKNKNEKLAFFINAYNILAIKVVLDHWPMESIKDAGSLFSSVWKKNAGKINNKPVSLDMIEHDILRKMGEPRIHMAVVCASVSCPDLRNEPFISKELSEQLDDQTRLFLANPKKGLAVKGNDVHVSRIFDWFEHDFDDVGGLKKFFASYRNDLPKKYSLKADLPYNWNLNSR